METGLIQHAKFELDYNGFTENNPNENDVRLRNEVLELLGVFSRQGHSRFATERILSIFNKLVKCQPMSPLTFKDDEFIEFAKGHFQNQRCFHIFKKADGHIYDNDAFARCERYKKYFVNQGLVECAEPQCFRGAIYECDHNVATGRYFDSCYIKQRDIMEAAYNPIETIRIKSIGVEVAPDWWMGFAEAHDITVSWLDAFYDVDWKIDEEIKGQNIMEIKVDTNEHTRNRYIKFEV